jgi:transposase-like protein
MAKLGQKFIKYEAEFRLHVVLECLDNTEPLVAIAEKYNINRNTVESWVRSYKAGRLNQKKGRPTLQMDAEYWKLRYELSKKYRTLVTLPAHAKKLCISKSEEKSIRSKHYAMYLAYLDQRD